LDGVLVAVPAGALRITHGKGTRRKHGKLMRINLVLRETLLYTRNLSFSSFFLPHTPCYGNACLVEEKCESLFRELNVK